MKTEDSGNVWQWGLAPWGRALSEILFPSPCLICDGGDTPLCENCQAFMLNEAVRTCERCAMPVGPFESLLDGCTWCRHRRLGFDEAIALGPYEGPLRVLCLKLKRVRNAWIGQRVVDLLVQARGDRLRALNPTAVAFVPLHWLRRACRGYNQSEELARLLAGSLNVPVLRGLRRVTYTPKLMDYTRAQRARILKDAFQARVIPASQRQTILLVDDILTSGATSSAVAKSLKSAGAKRVVTVVLARAQGMYS